MGAIAGNHPAIAELAKALGLPKRTVGFTLRAMVGEVVAIDVQYHPDVVAVEEWADKIPPIFKSFELVEPEKEDKPMRFGLGFGGIHIAEGPKVEGDPPVVKSPVNPKKEK